MASATIALIGGTGFIGRHLLERLTIDPATAGERVRVLVHASVPGWLAALPHVEPVAGDLTQAESLSPLLSGVRTVINLAGQGSSAPEDYQRLNRAGSLVLAKACLRHRVRRVLHASSALVYGNVLDATEALPCRPLSPYAALKLSAEEILCGLLPPKVSLLRLRLANVYGPLQVKGLMPYLVNRILSGQRISIDADGAQVRDFVHAWDVAGAFIKGVSSEYAGAVNIGSGHATSVMSLVRLLEDLLDRPATGHYCPEQTGGERRNTACVARAGAVLGWRASIELAEGVRSVLEPRRTARETGVCA